MPRKRIAPTLRQLIACHAAPGAKPFSIKGSIHEEQAKRELRALLAVARAVAKGHWCTVLDKPCPVCRALRRLKRVSGGKP